MKLTSENVQNIFFASLYKTGEDTTGHLKIEGIRGPIGFHPERVKEHAKDIEEMLLQLPNEFMKFGGGGYTFLNGCMTADGEQWGEQSNVDELICLGMAIGKCSFLMPREMWGVLPGGMPYFVVDNSNRAVGDLV